jgi:hypothetical protein
MTPPECIDDGVQFFADGFWGFEDREGINGGGV